MHGVQEVAGNESGQGEKGRGVLGTSVSEPQEHADKVALAAENDQGSESGRLAETPEAHETGRIRPETNQDQQTNSEEVGGFVLVLAILLSLTYLYIH